MSSKSRLFFLLFLLLPFQGQSQTSTYSSTITQKIKLVEDSLIFGGSTYLNAPRYSLQE